METTLSFLARNWGIVLLRGIAAIVFGVAAFLWPGLTLAVLVFMFGAYILVDGVFGTMDAIRYRNDKENWRVRLLDGFLGIIAGALMLLMPVCRPSRC